MLRYTFCAKSCISEYWTKGNIISWPCLSLWGNYEWSVDGKLLYILETQEECDVIKILIHTHVTWSLNFECNSTFMMSQYSWVSKIYSKDPLRLPDSEVLCTFNKTSSSSIRNNMCNFSIFLGISTKINFKIDRDDKLK